MKQVRGNPTSNMNITTTTFTFTGTGASGTITVSGDCSSLERGQSVILDISGGTSGGYTDNSEYFVIPVASGSFRIAETKEDAFDGEYISGASGNAGSGTIYPIYKVGGILVANTAGNMYIRGIQNMSTGLSSFSLHTTVADGSIVPFLVKDISTSGLTAAGLVAWQD